MRVCVWQIMRESNLKITNLQTYADKQIQIVMFNWLIGKLGQLAA